MKVDKYLQALLILALGLVINPCLADEDIDSAAIYNGDIEIVILEDENGVDGIKALFTMEGTSEEIWGMLNDYDNYVEIYGGVDSLRILSQDSSHIKLEFWSDAVIKKIHFILQRTFDKKFQKITWVNAGGDYDYIRGGWEILDTPDDNVKLLVYQSYVKIKGSLISYFFVRGVRRKMRSTAADLRDWMNEKRYLYQEQFNGNDQQ